MFMKLLWHWSVFRGDDEDEPEVLGTWREISIFIMRQNLIFAAQGMCSWIKPDLEAEA